MMVASLFPGESPVSLDEARSWLRLGASSDDAVVAGLIRAATNMCEAFIGQWLIIRAVEEEMPIRSGAMILSKRPVVAIDGMTGLSADGPDFALTADHYRTDIARDGTARLWVERSGSAGRVRVAYRAGLAIDGNGVPEALRQGIIRMVAYMHSARDDDVGAAPTIITALWQPWRRLGLGA